MVVWRDSAVGPELSSVGNAAADFHREVRGAGTWERCVGEVATAWIFAHARKREWTGINVGWLEEVRPHCCRIISL